MAITFECTACKQSLEVDEKGAGQLVACPRCSTELLIPEPTSKLVHAVRATPPPAPVQGKTEVVVTRIQLSFGNVFALSVQVFLASLLISMIIGAVVFGIMALLALLGVVAATSL